MPEDPKLVEGLRETECLQFSEVTFSYGSHPVFENLSFTLPAGVVTGIIGPNGCGKSTALKLAVGLAKPDAGGVSLGGRSVAHLGAKERARAAAFMPQSVAPAAMSVEELVMCGRYAHLRMLQQPGEPDMRAAREAMALAGVEDIAHAQVAQLSGGQRQRAYLAMMLAQQANIMLLDEPTSALDIHASHAILDLVRRLAHERRASVVMVIHDLDAALRFCDHIVLMEQGRVACAGTPEEVLASGQIERTFNVAVETCRTPRGTGHLFF